jgi:integrase/recombinase XerD
MERSYESARALVCAAQGPLSPYLEAFVSSLIEQRYSAWCVYLKSYRAVDFSAWLAQQRTGARDIDERLIARYHRQRSRGRHRPWRNELYALHQLLIFLRERGFIDDPRAAAEVIPADRFVHRFEEHLHHVRGLAARTVTTYAPLARRFLIARFGSEAVDLRALCAAEVIDFVQRQAKRMPPRRLKLVISALRSFLSHAQMLGEVTSELVAAVPTVSVWSSTPALPRAIDAEHARRAIDACDCRTAVGRRDRAILLLLARLGLRSSEIAALMLDDVDWDASRLRVRGKGAREALLPLPADVGQAIAGYLQHGRLTADDRHLFLRARAPIRCFKNSAVAVGSIVTHALARAGVDAPHKGAHQFRHALATQMLRSGASLAEIGEVLRHRSPQTTALYARVDLVALRALALAWPGGAQ